MRTFDFVTTPLRSRRLPGNRQLRRNCHLSSLSSSFVSNEIVSVDFPHLRRQRHRQRPRQRRFTP